MNRQGTYSKYVFVGVAGTRLHLGAPAWSSGGVGDGRVRGELRVSASPPTSSRRNLFYSFSVSGRQGQLPIEEPKGCVESKGEMRFEGLKLQCSRINKKKRTVVAYSADAGH